MEEGPTTQGMFRVTSAAGITKQSMVVPSDFTHQQTGGYDYTPLYLRATSAQGNVLRTISTSTSSGNSLFWQWWTTSDGSALPWGIYNTVYDVTVSGSPTQGETWVGVGGGLGATYAYLGNVSESWSGEGEIRGVVEGKMVSSARIGTFSGPLYSVAWTDSNTWKGSGVGTFDASTPTLFGGGWSHNTYVSSFYECNNFANGFFGMTGRSDGTLDLLPSVRVITGIPRRGMRFSVEAYSTLLQMVQ